MTCNFAPDKIKDVISRGSQQLDFCPEHQVVMSKLIQLTILALLIQPSLAFSQVKFIETSAARGVVTFDPLSGFGNGVAAADFDGDGDIDFFLPQDFGVPNCLYVNDGSGNFVDQAASVGLDSLDAARVATWFDYDNDKRLDLIVADDLQISLYHQEENGSFTDRSVESGLRDVVEDGGHRCTMSIGDLDNDGDMDVVTGLWDGSYSILINDGGTCTWQARSEASLTRSKRGKGGKKYLGICNRAEYRVGACRKEIF